MKLFISSFSRWLGRFAFIGGFEDSPFLLPLALGLLPHKGSGDQIALPLLVDHEVGDQLPVALALQFGYHRRTGRIGGFGQAVGEVEVHPFLLEGLVVRRYEELYLVQDLRVRLQGVVVQALLQL